MSTESLAMKTWRPADDTNGQRMFLTTERIPMLAALLASPDELVDADD